MKKGRVYEDGIKCDCCDHMFLLTKFELHAGSNKHRAAANLYFDDKRSILDCQTQLQTVLPADDTKSVVTDVKSTKSSDYVMDTNDDHCSFCNDMDLPIKCAQCEHYFHIGCINKLGFQFQVCADDAKWLCTENCERIYLGLKEIRGKVIPLKGNNLNWSLLKYDENDTDVNEYKKLIKALDVMQKCFKPVKYPLSDKDMIEDVIFSRAIKRSNFKGFYTAVLEKNDEIITVVTLRVHGYKVAEIPFVATTLRQAEKVHQEKVQQEKLKAVKARLNFKEASQYSESGASSRRMSIKERLGSRHVCSMLGSPKPRRGHYESPRKRCPKRRTMFKRLDKVVAEKAATRVLAQEKRSLLSKNVISKDHPHKGRHHCRKANVAQEYIGSQSQRDAELQEGRLPKPTKAETKARQIHSPQKNTKEILALDKGKFKPPPPMKTLVEKRITVNSENFMKKKDQAKTPKKGETLGKDKPLVIVMVRPWQKVAKQRITQTLSPETVISFPPVGEEDGTEGPMIIEAEMKGHFIHRMYVDGGSSSTILYEHCFNRLLPEVRSQMVPTATPLVGFSREVICLLGQISMLVKIGDEEHSTFTWMNFMVVRSPSPYNGIIGRQGVRRIQAVPSMAHGMLKFPVKGRTVMLWSSKIIPLECTMFLGPGAQQLVIDQVTKEKIQVATHPEYPEQTIAIGFTLTKEGRKEFPQLAVIEVFEGRAKIKQEVRKLKQIFSKSAEKSLPFFKTLKKRTKKSDFQWTREAEITFRQMKKLIAELPMLTAPKEKEELIIYLAATKEAISAILMTKRDGKQMPVYFISRALQDDSGAGLILTNPEGMEFTYALRFRFEATNNEEEYEALIVGLRIAEQTGILLDDKKKARAIHRKSGRYVVTNKVLYKRSFLGPWLRCVGPLQTNYVLIEIHEGSCSMHVDPRSVVEKALRSGYYWPTMHMNAKKLIRECNDCQEAKSKAKMEKYYNARVRNISFKKAISSAEAMRQAVRKIEGSLDLSGKDRMRSHKH
nr:reverse transcriptase domain-containing protein [Tanacetum cinerariifolium]